MMRAMVLRALDKASCDVGETRADKRRLPETSLLRARLAQYESKRHRQARRFHDYLVRKLERGKMAEAELEACQEECADCRRTALIYAWLHDAQAD